jgi:uncharacterized protein (TIGR03790 family)
MRSWFVATAVVAVCTFSTPAPAQDGRNVLVVANEQVPGSVQIAEEYAAARAVPEGQLLRLRVSPGEEVLRADYERQIQSPISAWLASRSLQDRILYIVLAKGVPHKISGSSGRQGTAASVDSELALLYRRLTGIAVPIIGPIANPYFAGTADPLTAAKRFDRRTYDTYLVTRLDGFNVADALGLIKLGVSPTKEGRIVLDAPVTARDPRVGWVEEIASRLAAGAFAGRVMLETTGRAIQNETGVLGYVSWGSNDPALYVRHPNLTFVPGALASMFLSSDARTFVEPPAGWKPGPVLPQNAYAGSSQTLVADLIRSGVTGVAGQVSEPYLDGAIRPDILFDAYLKGFNLAESFYLAMPSLSWQTVIVGDPLCAPFQTSELTTADPEPPIDPETELPARFAARRLAALVRLAKPDALKLVLQAEARTAKGDTAGAVKALDKAASADRSSTFVWHSLADARERGGEYVEAAAANRRILELNSNDVIALNNLAYNLAVHQNLPQEGHPLAVRAAALARDNPTIEDTLGWIQHLLGDDAHALPLIERASRALPRSADVQLHAAVLYAKAGRLEDAAKALALSGELDAKLRERVEFRDLQRTLAGKH